MSRRFLTFVSAAATLLMALSPLLEFVDTWDKYPLTGNDTELTLLAIGAVVGLCLGIAWLAGQFLGLILSLLVLLSPDYAHTASQTHSRGADYLRLLFSPPLSLTSLRI